METRQEPKIICTYHIHPLADLVADGGTLAKGLLPGAILRLVTEDVASRAAIPAWCEKAGYRLLSQFESCTLVRNGVQSFGLREYTFDIQRPPVGEQI